MSIEFDCPSCGKHYSVSDALAGKRAKCRGCQTSVTVPQPVLAAVDDDDPADLSALESAAAESGDYAGAAGDDDYAYRQPATPIALAGPSRRSRGQGGSTAAAIPPRPPPPVPRIGGRGGAAAAAAAAGALPAWAAPWVAVLGRTRGMPWWAWATCVLAVLLLVGFVSDTAATADQYFIGGVGVLALLAALVWAVVVGVAVGSKAIVGAMVASPLFAAFLLIKFGVKMFTGGRSESSSGGLSPGLLAGGIVFGLVAVAVIAGLMSNPRAFKRPFLTAVVGGLLLAVCWLPASYQKKARAAEPYPGRSTPRYAPGGGGPPEWHPRVAAGPVSPPSYIPRAQGLPGPASPAPARVVPSPDATPVGETSVPAIPAADGPLQAKWGGAWFDARVVRRERGWTQVEYLSDKTREWVEPWRTRAAGSSVDDVPATFANDTWGRSEAPAPKGPPGPKPSR